MVQVTWPIWPPCTYDPPHDITNNITCAPSEDSDQPGHPPSLIRVFAVRVKTHWALNYLLSTQWKLIRLGGSNSSLGAHVILLLLFVQRLIYAKNLKNLLLWNRKANDLESFFAASYTRVLLNLCKWWLWVDLDLFYGKVKIWSPFLLYGIKLKLWIFQNFV